LNISSTARAVRGVESEFLNITVLPAHKMGITGLKTNQKGKLKGTIT
jgi:hypothetical protein